MRIFRSPGNELNGLREILRGMGQLNFAELPKEPQSPLLRIIVQAANEILAKRNYPISTVQVINVPPADYDSLVNEIYDRCEELMTIYQESQLSSGKFPFIYLGFVDTVMPEVLNYILKNPDIVYVHATSNQAGIFETENVIFKQLKAAGKRIISSQLYGPGGEFNWSYCSYANIAMFKEVQDYLFAQFEKRINALGPENIYGIHLFEEDGITFGLDIDKPGDWTQNKGAVRSGYEDGDIYSNYSQLYNGEAARWNMRQPQVAKFLDVARREMNLAPTEKLENLQYQLQYWISRRLWCGAHRAFLTFIKNKYPGLKRGIWGGYRTDIGMADMKYMSDITDFIVSDCYSGIKTTHDYNRIMRLLHPSAEIFMLVCEQCAADMKPHFSRLMYIDGITAGGFFEKKSIENVTKSMDTLKENNRLPAITPKAKTLVMSGNFDNGYETNRVLIHAYTYPDVMSVHHSMDIDINNYSILHLHYADVDDVQGSINKYKQPMPCLDDIRLKQWVYNGGIFIYTRPVNFPETEMKAFFVREKIWWTWKYPAGQDDTVVSIPSAMVSKYKLATSYEFKYFGTHSLGISKGDIFNNTAIVDYGQGCMVIFGMFPSTVKHMTLANNNQSKESDRALGLMVGYYNDVIRGVIALKAPNLLDCIIPAGEKPYLRYTDSRVDCKIYTGDYGGVVSSNLTVR